ncbi:MAG: glycosyltransferase family 9 protein [Gemmatimonadota bacterium]|nr:glycosyltransferase family 9 protein [Gemmatimonadota bacterium]
MRRPGRLAVRAPNHLGELVLALPALAALARRARREDGATVLLQLPASLVPLIGLAGLDADLLPLTGRRRLLRAAGDLRRRGADRGVLLTPSLSSALAFRLAGLRVRRGTAGGGRTALLTDPVDREPLLRGHRVAEFLAIAGEPAPRNPPAPRIGADGAATAWRRRRAALGVPPESGPVVGLFPGANAPSRRWPAARFAEVGRGLADRGARVYVFGGPGETALTARVAAGAAGPAGGRIHDLGGRTGVAELAGALQACHVLVTNDTGPMHLAAALDRPIVALEGAADPVQTRPLATRVRLVGRFDLPCVPCRRNACPRRGRGTVLAEARLECLMAVGSGEVLDAALSLLEEMDR